MQLRYAQGQLWYVSAHNHTLHLYNRHGERASDSLPRTRIAVALCTGLTLFWYGDGARGSIA